TFTLRKVPRIRPSRLYHASSFGAPGSADDHRSGRLRRLHAAEAWRPAKITVADLPEPKPSESVDNGPTLVQRPEGAWPIAPAGFTVQLYAGGDAATPMQRSENKKE